MKQKIRNAVKDMYKHVKRVDTAYNHHYERKSDGKWFAGVTTISALGSSSSSWLAPWGSKECAKALGFYDEVEGEDHLEDILNVEKIHAEIKEENLEQYLERLRQAKGAFRRKSKEAMDFGTDGHDWLEQYCLAKIRGQKIPEKPKGVLGEIVQYFIEWEKDNVKELFLAEGRVAHLKEEFAGTLDLLAEMKNGEIAVIDFKFSNNVSNSWRLQTSAYAKAFEPYEIEVTGRYMLRFPKTEYLNEWDKKIKKYKKVKNKFQVISYPKEDLEFDYETFLSLRRAFKWINKYERTNTN